MSEPTVSLGYTHTGIVHHNFARSLYLFILHDLAERRLVVSGAGQGTIMAFSSAYIPQARNDMITHFLAGKQEWLWMLDYDIDFDPNTLYYLIDTALEMEVDIIGALYWTQGQNGIVPIFYDKEENDLYRPRQTWTVGDVIKCDNVGMGCTLIHRHVLESMRAAYEGPWHWCDHDKGGGEVYGEDITFSRRAQKLGFDIYGHTGVQVAHKKPFRIGGVSVPDGQQASDPSTTGQDDLQG